ncbi:MAG: sel1 repeat family protein [Variovorax sp.]|nr:MAG: sel1 repeat family protein [Variovorax sp.]
MSLSAAAQHTLALWEHRQPFGSGLAFEPLLRRCRLDYSPASLARIDAFLDALRNARQPEQAQFLADPAQRQLLYLLAFYAGEVLGRALGKAPLWLNAAQAAALAPQQPLLGQPLRAALCARFGQARTEDAAFFLPLDALCERLFLNPAQAANTQGLQWRAQAWWPAALLEAERRAQPLPPLPGRPWPPALPAAQGNDPWAAPAPPLPAGIDIDTVTAAPAPEPLVDDDTPAALNAQAMRLLKGDGVPRDPDQARALWERAAAQGHAESLNQLGTLIAKGIGGPVSLTAAMDHYRSAAEKGLAAAQMNMARMHLQYDGVAPDLVEAERWLRLAAAQDHAKARELIKELELDRAPAMADTGFGELADNVVGWLRDRRRR